MIRNLIRTLYSHSNKHKTYYKILEIKPSATSTEIKESYIKLVKKYHPDCNKLSQEKFLDITCGLEEK